MTFSDTLIPKWLSEELGVYSLTTESPFLAGMPFPKGGEVWENLAAWEISWVVCLSDDRAPYDPAPLKLLAQHGLHDFYCGGAPDNPLAERGLIKSIAGSMAEVLDRGESVVAHCVGGTGRTGTVLAGVLIELGISLPEVFGIMERVNVLRGRRAHGWPESPWQRDLISSWV